jgi:hypothetical protein
MTKTEKKETYTLVTTDSTQFKYADYLEYCEDNGIEPEPDGSSEYYDWCADEAEKNYDCDMDNLMYSKLKDKTFLIEGNLGLWWGRPTIKPVVINGIIPSIKRCFGRDINNIEVELNTKDGFIHIQSHHHDGTNFYTLKMLNKNGEKWAQNAIDKGEDIELNNRWWTKLKSINDIWK